MRLKHFAVTTASALALTIAAGMTSPAAAQEEICENYVTNMLTSKTVHSKLSGLPVGHDGVNCYIKEPEPTAARVEAPPPPKTEYMVFFDFDQSDLSDVAMETITEATETASSIGAAGIEVVGHTDTSGPRRYNQRLSERRAEAVRQQLVQAGVSPESVATAGVGEGDLLVDTPDGIREASNRRAKINIIEAQ